MRDLTTTGVWTHVDGLGSADAVDAIRRLEQFGYSTVWLPETIGRDPFALIGFLMGQTEHLGFATGIANIFNRHPGAMRQAANALSELSGDRFLLGLGVSHGPIVAGVRGLDYSKPLSTMRSYLEQYAASPYLSVPPSPEPKVVLAALGPKMLELAGTAADGALPYWTTPEHTATAREIMGPDALLCVEQKICLTTDESAARTAADEALSIYASLPNYRNNWLRLGFTDDEIDSRAHRFVDAVVAWGTESSIRARLDEHRDAGADHICIQPLLPGGSMAHDWNAFEAFAPGA